MRQLQSTNCELRWHVYVSVTVCVCVLFVQANLYTWFFACHNLSLDPTIAYLDPADCVLTHRGRPIDKLACQAVRPDPGTVIWAIAD